MSQRKPTQQEIEKFCNLYVFEKMHQVDAWRAVFPNAKSSDKTAGAKASEFKSLPTVSARIKEMREQIASNFRDEFDLDANDLAKEFYQMYQFDIADIIDDNMQYKHPKLWPPVARKCVQSFDVKTIHTASGDEITTVSVKFIPRIGLGKMIADYIGMFDKSNADEVEVETTDQEF